MCSAACGTSNLLSGANERVPRREKQLFFLGGFSFCRLSSNSGISLTLTFKSNTDELARVG